MRSTRRLSRVVVCAGFQPRDCRSSLARPRGRWSYGRRGRGPGLDRHRDGPRRSAPACTDCVPVRVDELGIDVAALDASGARVVVVLTPAHQWPTEVVLAAERRHGLIAWARRRDAS